MKHQVTKDELAELLRRAKPRPDQKKLLESYLRHAPSFAAGLTAIEQLKHTERRIWYGR